MRAEGDQADVRREYHRGIAKLWLTRQSARKLAYDDYLRGLVQRARSLRLSPVPTEVDLDWFRREVLPNPDALRKRLQEDNLQRLAALDSDQRAALSVIETSPDLLSPLGQLRYEPSHTRLIGFFLDARRCPALAGPLLKALLVQLDVPRELIDAGGLVVSTELPVPGGRVDVTIEGTQLLLYLELKVDSVEGPGQLLRYRKALNQKAGNRLAKLGFLTMPGAAGPAAGLNCQQLTFVDLLACWLPCAQAPGHATGYLVRYLGSIARLLGVGSTGTFHEWSFAEQRAALDFITHSLTERLNDNPL